MKKPWIIIILLTFFLYANTLFNDYALDDAVMTHNKYVQMGLKGIPKILTDPYYAGREIGEKAGVNYRPLPQITFAIEKELFGNRPFIGHLINLLLFALTGILIFEFFLKSLSYQNHTIPLLTSLLFIAHPLHVEVVANIKSRDEILTFIFFLSSIFLFTQYLEYHCIKKLILGNFLFFCSLLSKEHAITFLVAIPLAIFFLTPYKLKAIIKIFGFLWIPFAIYALLRIEFLGSFKGIIPTHPYFNILYLSSDIWQQYATAFSILGKYLSLLIAPHPLAYHYSLGQVPLVDFSNLLVIVVITAILIIGFYVIRNFQRKNLLIFAILFFCVTYSPASNLIVLSGVTLAERLLYIPSLSFCLILSLGFNKLIAHPLKANESFHISFFRKNLIFSFLLFTLLGCYSFKTIDRNQAWKDTLTINETDIQSAPHNPVIALQYKFALIEKAKQAPPQEKITLLNKAVTVLEACEKKYRNTAYQSVVSSFPKHLSSSYFNLGTAHLTLQGINQATLSFEQGIKSNPMDLKNYYRLGEIYLTTQNHPAAIRLYRDILKIDPQNTTALEKIEGLKKEIY